MTEDAPGFGIYIHWPFCAQKCPYCDFNSHVRFGGWDEPRYLAAYLRELDHVAGLTSPLPGGERSEAIARSFPDEGAPTVTSIFFGGGTPSLMQPATVSAILDRIAALWPVAPDAEVTLEANPGSVEAGRFAGYRAAGVNRVSIGVQSLRDPDLKRLGRIHTAAEAKDAVALAHRTFDRVSFDLIYARPHQSLADWRAELAEALAMAGRHLSLYQLTIEPETPFADLYARGRLTIPPAEAAHDLYAATQELTAAAGLPQYEISNHAAPGEESRHNLTYWRYGTYAGIGPGAHGRLRTADGLLATQTERNPEHWLARVEDAGHGFAETEVVSPAAQADEMLLMGLRLAEGVDLDRLARISGLRPRPSLLAELAGQGLIERIAAAPSPCPSPHRGPLRKGDRSPPPCGEGLGVGGIPTQAFRNPPLLASPTRGEGHRLELRQAPRQGEGTQEARSHFTSPRWGEVGSDCKSLPGEGTARPMPMDTPEEPGLDEIRACLGPGLAPATLVQTKPLGRIRATGEGRFVLNRLVLELASGLEPALPGGVRGRTGGPHEQAAPPPGPRST